MITEEDLQNGLLEVTDVDKLVKDQQLIDMQRRFQEFNRSQIEKGHAALKETEL